MTGLRATRTGRDLVLEINTPNSRVNVLRSDTADALREAVEAASPARVDRIVIRSTKPGSFINGAQLMLAQMAKSPESLARLSSPIRRAYEALQNTPITTIADISGSCFGCGVELTLRCDYRFMDDAESSELYLTEVNDYLLVPAFGATQLLPRLVGVPAAIELLLHGTRWRGDEARAAGLADVSTDAPPRRAMARWDAGAERAVQAERNRIAALPALERDVCEQTLELIAHAAKTPELTPSDFDAEQRACAVSLQRDSAKRALEFFFSRQLAEVTATRAPVSPQVSQKLTRAWDEALNGLIADRALFDFGFRRTDPSGESDPTIVDAVLAALMKATLELLHDGSVAHVSQIDVILRDELGFPLGLGAFSRYMTRERTRALGVRDPVLDAYVRGARDLS